MVGNLFDLKNQLEHAETVESARQDPGERRRAGRCRRSRDAGFKGEDWITQAHLTAEEVRRLLIREIERAGGQTAWSRHTGVERTYLNSVVQGRRSPISEAGSCAGIKRIVLPHPREVLKWLQSEVQQMDSRSKWARREQIFRRFTSGK